MTVLHTDTQREKFPGSPVSSFQSKKKSYSVKLITKLGLNQSDFSSKGWPRQLLGEDPDYVFIHEPKEMGVLIDEPKAFSNTLAK